MIGEELSGYNGARRIFEQGSSVNEEMDAARSFLPPPIFRKAVVVDILSNPRALTAEEIAKYESESISPELIKRAPRNSIIAREITRKQDLSNSSPRIYFPMGEEALKPGEQVFVFFEDPIVNDQIGYWWKRIPQPIDTDDINFTHADRKYQINDGLSTSDKFLGKTMPPPDFINGGDREEEQTLANVNDYELINKNSKVNSQIIKEPVARFVKRPGDYVIQGSNAARIVCGLDRASSGPAPASGEVRKNSATIDLVVGFGREGTETAPKTIKNSRGEFEVDKTPEKNKSADNVLEGDPDMIADKSRIYISESTAADENFEIEVDGIPQDVGQYPAIVIHTDRGRIICRENIKIVAGSSAITLDINGNINIFSDAIKIGGVAAELGAARNTDKTKADASMNAWIGQVSAALNVVAGLFGGPTGTPLLAAGPGAVPTVVPPSDFGFISTSSNKVKIE